MSVVMHGYTPSLAQIVFIIFDHNTNDWNDSQLRDKQLIQSYTQLIRLL